MQSTEYQIIFGIGETQDGKPLLPIFVEGIISEAGFKLSTVFGGYTRTDTQGGWIDPQSGNHIHEPGVCLITITDKDAAEICILDVARTLKRRLNQHTVLIVSQAVSVREV